MVILQPENHMRKFIVAASTAAALSVGLPAFASPEPPAKASAQVTINAPVVRVWSLLTEVEAWPQWNNAVESAKLEGPFIAGSVFRWRAQGFTVMSTLMTVDAPHRIVWTGEAFGTQARHKWEIVPTEQGVIVRTSETFDGWLPRLMPQTMQKKLDETLPAWLAALKLEAERP